MADETSPYERLIDAFVHAPIGFALYARDTAPGFLRVFVARGRQELARRKREVDGTVDQAKSVGRFAMTYGPPVVKQRVEGGVDRARDLAEGVVAGLRPASSPSSPPRPGSGAAMGTSPPNDTLRWSRHDAPADSAGARGAPEAVAPAFDAPPAPASALPIPDYDELSASQVVERLAGLAVEELDAIAAYERARRGRRTILGKIEQLTA